ncbi:MAG: PKD domain-containing protein [Bacteroidota bacterium]
MKNTVKLSWVVLLIFITAFSISCKKKSTTPEMIVSFTYKVDVANFKKVTFTNASQNAVSYAWTFGDNTVSTETSPVHTYTAEGAYVVKLTATSEAGVVESYHITVTITDPDVELAKLAGTATQSGKTWKLLRSTTTGRYPLQCGPWDRSTIWWAMGLGNDELANRPCMLNDEWTFLRDGTFSYDAKTDYWAEGGIFNPANVCAATTTMVGPNGEDLTAWGNGTHHWKMTAGTTPTITAIGKGAFIGFIKLGNKAETKIPLDSVQYSIVKLTDGAVDTLVIEGQYKWDLTDGGYWRFTLVHYDDPTQEPPIPGNKPSAGFTMVINGLTVTLTNTTTNGVTYNWDFGDGLSSSVESPTHTYATDGIYTITLTATNPNGVSTSSTVAFVSTTVLTDALLQGGPWKVRVEEKSIFVGGAMGSSAWWTLPKAFMVSGTGTDDWTCITDDQFTFSAGGVYTYATNGSARNDGYFGTPNGCWSDAQIAASANGAAFGSATHSYVFTPASGANRPIITLTNGAGKAAFIGFYKGYYGGENNGTNPPNNGNLTNKYEVMGYAHTATKDYLFVTVDISAGHDGSAAWSAILER